MNSKVTAADVKLALEQEIIPGKATGLARFFKTGPGQYGEGDQFIGVMVPQQKKVAKYFWELPLKEIKELLYSPIHEHRLTGTLILVLQFDKAKKDLEKRKGLIEFYLANTARMNNWDLVDSSADILGEYLTQISDTSLLDKLAKSSMLWEQRIAIVSTFYMIKNDSFNDSFRMMETLMDHKHDLIHKACGWMLREIGKRDRNAETSFLNKHYKKMPRTMLRYAIEHYPETERKAYLLGTV